MSMLAEPRRKQKSTLNPRGKFWTEDSNKIGQKMLEKMGWTSGKGLGANEQGIVKCCTTPFKNDTIGLGYDKNPDKWIEHQVQFDQFLKQLEGNLDQNIVLKLENKNNNPIEQSLEMKSKQSCNRIHYQKFVRSKDLNKYKSKDLANIIFGRKELTERETNVEKNNVENEIGVKDSTHGFVTINSGSITDYFKSKSKKLNCDKSLTNHMTNNKVTNSESENENDRIGFGFAAKVGNTSTKYKVLENSDERNFYAFDNPCLGFNSPVDSNTDGTTKELKEGRKKRFDNANLHFNRMDEYNVQKKIKTEITDGHYQNVFTNPALNLDTGFEENHNGKEFEVSRAEFGLENCGLDLTDEKNNKKRVTFNDRIMLHKYSTDSFNKKKKKKGEATLDKFEVENKKYKKRKHETSVSDGFINEALDVEFLCEEINDNELNEHQSKKIKKRKICKISNLETIQESPEQEKEIDIEMKAKVIILENEKTDIGAKKSNKKKKKNKKEIEKIIGIDIKNEEPDNKIEEIIRNKEVKRDKHKEEEEEITILKCKKKKKKKDKENCKTESKHTVLAEISSHEKNMDTQKKPSMKQQQIDHSLDVENENATEIETLPVVTLETQEGTKRKKKKKNNDKTDCLKNEISVCDVEKEISDKEHVNKSQDAITKKLKKKDKKYKKSNAMSNECI